MVKQEIKKFGRATCWIKIDMDKLELAIEEELKEQEPCVKTIIDIVLEHIEGAE